MTSHLDLKSTAPCFLQRSLILIVLQRIDIFYIFFSPETGWSNLVQCINDNKIGVPGFQNVVNFDWAHFGSRFWLLLRFDSLITFQNVEWKKIGTHKEQDRLTTCHKTFLSALFEIENCKKNKTSWKGGDYTRLFKAFNLMYLHVLCSYRWFLRSRQLGGLILVSWLEVPPRYKAG